MPDITAAPAHLSHRSPGLTAIYNEIKGSRVNHVLDLGASSAKSFNFFAQLSCKIRFESLNDLFVEEETKGPADVAFLEQFGLCVDDRDLHSRFDLVLTWDLFNYLDLSCIEWLMNKIAHLCRPNALIHSIRYVGAAIPDQPREFQIVNQYQVLISDRGEPAPRRHTSHDTARLLRLLPNFYLEHTYLNFDGMVPGLMENVLRFQPEKSLSGRRQSSEELTDAEMLYAGAATQQARQLHISEALAGVFAKIAHKAQPAILDLGPRTRQNHDFFHGITQDIYAEDLYQELQIQEKSGGAAQFKAHMLNYPEPIRFDLILLWDLLNFLTAPAIEELFRHLHPMLHERSIIHAVVYSGREIPAAPQTFLLRSSSEIEVLLAPKQPTINPLTSSRLLKLMKTFRLEETFVFRPGMQRGIYEYLFRPNFERTAAC